MDLKNLIKQYLTEARVMQLASSIHDHPWVCNVHFYADDDLNLYWMSTEARRHSQEIAQNAHVAMTIKVHEDTPDEKYVIGLSAEGTAEVLTDAEIKEVGPKYSTKLDKDPNLVNDILSGKNPHKFYRFKVTKFVLFDTKNFPKDPRQELAV
jgi:uncharacterized protein YhbP (UPF0306 family)